MLRIKSKTYAYDFKPGLNQAFYSKLRSGLSPGLKFRFIDNLMYEYYRPNCLPAIIYEDGTWFAYQ